MSAEPTAQDYQALLREHLQTGQAIRFRVVGGSMRPLIQAGDTVVISPLEQPATGDILLYQQGEAWFVHRLLSELPQADGQAILKLHGDARHDPDPAVLPEAVLGQVTSVERGDRSWSVELPIFRLYGHLICWPPFRTLMIRIVLRIDRRIRSLFV